MAVSSTHCWCILGRESGHTTLTLLLICFPSKQWFQINDEEVTRTALPRVLTQQPSMLFYCRRGKENAADKDSALNLQNYGTMLYEVYAGFSVSTDFSGLEGCKVRRCKIFSAVGVQV